MTFQEVIQAAANYAGLSISNVPELQLDQLQMLKTSSEFKHKDIDDLARWEIEILTADYSKVDSFVHWLEVNFNCIVSMGIDHTQDEHLHTSIQLATYCK